MRCITGALFVFWFFCLTPVTAQYHPQYGQQIPRTDNKRSLKRNVRKAGRFEPRRLIRQR
jgi:hypothetical protein